MHDDYQFIQDIKFLLKITSQTPTTYVQKQNKSRNRRRQHDKNMLT